MEFGADAQTLLSASFLRPRAAVTKAKVSVAFRPSLFYGTERNGICRRIILRNGTEHCEQGQFSQVEFDAVTLRNLFFKVQVNLIRRGNSD